MYSKLENEKILFKKCTIMYLRMLDLEIVIIMVEYVRSIFVVN